MGLPLTPRAMSGAAFCFGSVVRRYAPDGKLSEEITLPVSMPTSCAFGGPDYRELYVTTATTTLSTQQLIEQPTAGSVFRVHTASQGRQSFRFAG